MPSHDRYFTKAVLLLLVFTAAVLFMLSRGARKSFAPVPSVSCDAPRAPRPEEKPVIALVLDDLGYSRLNLNDIKELGVPLTLAVLPDSPYAGQVAAFSAANGLETILHLPLEPDKEGVPLEKSTMRTGMTPGEVGLILSSCLDKVPGAVGVSNHMGSRATRDSELMRLIFLELKNRELFFLDSYTSPDSVCAEIALDTGIPCLRREIFLDNEREKASIRRQLRAAAEKAAEHGPVIAIGHDRSSTISALREEVPVLRREGVRFVLLTDILDRDGDRPGEEVMPGRNASEGGAG